MEEIIFWMEEAADSGVKKIADKVAGDVELVTDRRPRVLYGTSQEELADVAERAETVIVPATVGKSRLLEQMEEEKRIGLEQIRGKRECYGWFFLNDPEWHGTQILLIAGSDKRGTIYCFICQNFWAYLRLSTGVVSGRLTVSMWGFVHRWRVWRESRL